MKTTEQDAHDILANWNSALDKYTQGEEGGPDDRLHFAAQFIGRKILVGGVVGEDEPPSALCVFVQSVGATESGINFETQVQSESPTPFSFRPGLEPSGIRILSVIHDAS